VIERIPCRVLPHEVRGGADNMGLDHALLDAVDASPTEAVLRTYGWLVPTLSLGYFQHLAEAQRDPRWQGVPIVRRPSGGGALWHDRELTYALVVPRSHPLAGRPSALYREVHAAIVDVMQALAIPASRRGDAARDSSPRPFLCFLDRDPEDVLVLGAKVVGSAQRRRPSAVLQHGSLLLERSAATPELPGLGDLGAAGLDLRGWAERLGDSLPRALGLDPRPGRADADEEAHARTLAAEVYSSPAWTARH